MHGQALSILLLNCLHNYLKFILLGMHRQAFIGRESIGKIFRGIPYEFREIHGENPWGNSIRIHEGKSMGEFQTTTNTIKRVIFVLAKSLVLFHGQVSKVLRSIFHQLVSLLALIFTRW